MKAFVLFACVLFFSSCDNSYTEKELYGSYVPINYKNTTDTILLEPKGMYHRKVYDKNKNLVLEMEGKWNLVAQKTKIKLNHFYLNLDDNLLRFPESARDTSMEVITNLETRSGVIKFCVGYHENENCYKKIK